MPVSVKAATPRAYINWLTREQKIDAVLARVPASTAALIRQPLLPSSWVESPIVEPILWALDELDGSNGVRRMSRDVLRAELLPPLRQMAATIVRLLGTSPATIYAHINDLARTSIRGLDFKYSPHDDRSGVVHVSYDVDYRMADSVFVALIATLEATFDLCGVRGLVSEPRRRGANCADYAVRW